jgi:BirA family biotin operon repressor/biotin-[acetyl-CoA-carboxylase] ligase
MEQDRLFSILDSVDSTNNYAMAQVHEGLAKHGSAVFARHQKSGKGQRGKAWMSNPGENIILSITVQPSRRNDVPPFEFNAVVALQCARFLHSLTGEDFKIKWPNDLYWRDRKAGGILIENVLQGNEWKWAVLGIGINVNQTRFPSLSNPASLSSITGRAFDSIELSMQLHRLIMDAISRKNAHLMDEYNSLLYKKDEQVQLRKNNIVFNTTIRHVDRFGHLHTSDVMDRTFNFGEVEWVWS